MASRGRKSTVAQWTLRDNADDMSDYAKKFAGGRMSLASQEAKENTASDNMANPPDLEARTLKNSREDGVLQEVESSEDSQKVQERQPKVHSEVNGMQSDEFLKINIEERNSIECASAARSPEVGRSPVVDAIQGGVESPEIVRTPGHRLKRLAVEISKSAGAGCKKEKSPKVQVARSPMSKTPSTATKSKDLGANRTPSEIIGTKRIPSKIPRKVNEDSGVPPKKIAKVSVAKPVKKPQKPKLLANGCQKGKVSKIPEAIKKPSQTVLEQQIPGASSSSSNAKTPTPLPKTKKAEEENLEAAEKMHTELVQETENSLDCPEASPPQAKRALRRSTRTAAFPANSLAESKKAPALRRSSRRERTVSKSKSPTSTSVPDHLDDRPSTSASPALNHDQRHSKSPLPTNRESIRPSNSPSTSSFGVPQSDGEERLSTSPFQAPEEVREIQEARRDRRRSRIFSDDPEEDRLLAIVGRLPLTAENLLRMIDKNSPKTPRRVEPERSETIEKTDTPVKAEEQVAEIEPESEVEPTPGVESEAEVEPEETGRRRSKRSSITMALGRKPPKVAKCSGRRSLAQPIEDECVLKFLYDPERNKEGLAALVKSRLETVYEEDEQEDAEEGPGPSEKGRKSCFAKTKLARLLNFPTDPSANCKAKSKKRRDRAAKKGLKVPKMGFIFNKNGSVDLAKVDKLVEIMDPILL